MGFNLPLKMMALITLTFAIGCASTSNRKSDSSAQIYLNSYDDVWGACQKALLQYPIRVNNSDTGELETDVMKGSTAFKSPDQTVPFSSGYRYRILLRVVRGGSKGRPAIKVVVTKDIENQRDFFSNPEKLPSDNLEETVILYRIERELSLARTIVDFNQRAQKKSK